MKIQFKTKNLKQIEAARYWIDDTTEQILYGGAKGGGKTTLGCGLIFGDALLYPDTHYFIARSELNDLRKFTIPSIYEIFQIWGLKFDDYSEFNGQDNCFNLRNGSKVFLIACKETPADPLFERFGSMQMTRGWIEEGGEIAEAAKSNLWLSIGRWKNDIYNLKKKLLITANPKKGWMKRDFVDLAKKGILENDKKYIQAFATDNAYLTKDYLFSLQNEKNKIRRQRLWLGDWEYDENADSLISSDALIDLFSNTIEKKEKEHKYLIADVARLGKDATVFSFWRGLEVYRIEKFLKQTTDITAQKIKDFSAMEEIPYSHILIDEDGIGGGVVDNLYGVKGFTANSSPIKTKTQIKIKKTNLAELNVLPEIRPNFQNLKAQCGFKLAEMINEHKIRISAAGEKDEIIEELSGILRQKDQDKDGKLKLRPKEEVKTEIGRSPDIGDTFVMRMFFELLELLEEPDFSDEDKSRILQNAREREAMTRDFGI